MNLRAIKALFIKETRDNIRDRRALVSSLVMGPLLGPFIFAVLISFILQTEIEQAEKTLKVPIHGTEYAPALMDHLSSLNLEIVSLEQSAESNVKDASYKFAVEILPDYASQLSQGLPAKVDIFYDSTNRKTNSQVRRIRNALSGYIKQLGHQRLLLRGINPEILQSLDINRHDLAPKGAGAARMLSMLPYFVMMAVFMGGMHVAIDATAGERERKSLEPLFTLPVPRWQLMTGKMLATALFASISLALNLLAFKFSLYFIPMDELNMKLALTSLSYLLIFVLMLPMAVFASALQTIIAAHAKTFREAQTYVSFLMFVPMIPSLGLMVAPVDNANWMYWLPILSQNILMLDILRGEAVSLMSFLAACFSSGLIAVALAWVAARLYNNEKLAVAV